MKSLDIFSDNYIDRNPLNRKVVSMYDFGSQIIKNVPGIGFLTSPSFEVAPTEQPKTVEVPELAIVEVRGQQVVITELLIEQYSGSYRYDPATETRERANEYRAVYNFVVEREASWGNSEAEAFLGEYERGEGRFFGRTQSERKDGFDLLVFLDETYQTDFKLKFQVDLSVFKLGALFNALQALIPNSDS